MCCDAQRRVAERCDAPGRVALPAVMSISPTRLIDDPQHGAVARRLQDSAAAIRGRHLFVMPSNDFSVPVATGLAGCVRERFDILLVGVKSLPAVSKPPCQNPKKRDGTYAGRM